VTSRYWDTHVVDQQSGLELETLAVSVPSMREGNSQPFPDYILRALPEGIIIGGDSAVVRPVPDVWQGNSLSIMLTAFNSGPVVAPEGVVPWIAKDWASRLGLLRRTSADGLSSIDADGLESFLSLHLEGESVLVLDGSAPRRRTMTALAGEGALLIAGFNAVGPVAVVLIPAGLVLLRLVNPIADGLIRALQRVTGGTDG
jgi:hypothetical protein